MTDTLHDYIFVSRPGMVPDRKGPYPTKTAKEQALRELYAIYPDCECAVVEAPVATWPQDGREWLDMHGDKRRKPAYRRPSPAPMRPLPSSELATVQGPPVRGLMFKYLPGHERLRAKLEQRGQPSPDQWRPIIEQVIAEMREAARLFRKGAQCTDSLEGIPRMFENAADRPTAIQAQGGGVQAVAVVVTCGRAGACVDLLPPITELPAGAKLYAAPPTPAVPEGWALVQVEATEEMAAAGGRSVNESLWHCHAVFRAMLAAAPKPPAQHDSDCATHNEPAYPNGACDCSAAPEPPQETAA